MANEPGIFSRLLTNPVQLLLTVLISVIVFQIIAFLVGLAYPPAAGVKLGWAILLIAVGLSVFAAFQVVSNRFGAGKDIQRVDVFTLVLVSAGVVALFMFVPDLLPQVFSVAKIQLQSMVGMP